MPQRLKTISLLLIFISVTSFCINKPIHPHKCSTTRLLTSFDSPSPPEPPPEPKLSIFEELVKVMEEKVEEDPDSPPMEVEDLQKQYSSTLESLTIDLKSDLQDTATSSLEALTKQLEDDAEARIQEGERKITPMIARVEKERKNVEEAAKQLQTLAEQNSQKTNKPIDRLLSFGSQPLYKQVSELKRAIERATYLRFCK